MVIPPQIPGGFRAPTPGYNTIFYNQTLYGPMSGFTGNYYCRVPNVNQSRIPVRILGNIQSGGGFAMYNTSTITQIPTNTQTTTPQVPTSTQSTTSPVPVITQTTTPQVP